MRALPMTLAILVAALAGLWAAAPVDRLPPQAAILPAFPPDLPLAQVDDWLRAREGVFPDITPGAEKTVVWAEGAGERTPLALVYLHGFSATRAEIEPVPQQAAQLLGANLFLTRLAGHGRGGAAMAQATTADWALDLDEALGLGRLLGERVVLIGTSTGGTLAALAMLDPVLARDVAGVVLISPNFGLMAPSARLMDLPFADRWLPAIMGRERSATARNPDHARFWTLTYPATALFPMRAVQRQAGAADYAGVRVPVLALLAEEDQVVSPAATRAALARWGGAVRIEVITGAEDPGQHVITGRILSPSTTDRVADLIAEWIASL